MTVVARYQTPAAPAVGAEERRWNYLERMAQVLSASALVGKGMQASPENTMAGLLLCDALGVDPRTMISQLDVIDGHLEPKAQMYVSVAGLHGYDIRPVTVTNEAATVKIRRSEDDEWFEVVFTVDDARAAGLLDEWVECWESYNDDTGKRRNRLVRFVLDRAAA